MYIKMMACCNGKYGIYDDKKLLKLVFIDGLYNTYVLLENISMS